MKRIRNRTVAVLIFSLLTGAIVLVRCTKDKTPRPFQAAPCDPNKVYFETSIRPILNSNCAMSGCHDAATRQDGVDLSGYQGVLREVTPGRPGDSELYKKITEEDEEDRMPPPPKPELTAEQKNLIFTWIQQGADNATCAQDSAACNAVNVSFGGDVRPIISNNCIGCHSGSTINGGINLSDYSGVQAAAQSGKLYNAVSHNGQATPMPPNTKLSDCDIRKIRVWIDEGVKNN